MSEPIIAGTQPIVMTLEPGTYHWCTCGKSENQPFCNGAHKGTEFVPQVFTIEETKQVALCACKKTHHAPFRDGAHLNLVSAQAG